MRDGSGATRGCVVVWGLLGSYPFGGMSWQVLHHLVGLRRLGFDTWYVEESARRPLDPATYSPSDEWRANLLFLEREMTRIGFEDRWIYRPPGSGTRCYGAGGWSRLQRLYREADAVFNLCGGQELQAHHDDIRCLVLLQTDPVEPHVTIARGAPEAIDYYDRYDVLATYGENLGSADCLVPMDRFEWYLTRPPVCVDFWHPSGAPLPPGDHRLTTVAAWRSRGKDVEWGGERWSWSKHWQFEEYLDLPADATLPLEIAISGSREEDRDRLRAHGWRLIPATRLTDPRAYRDYIRQSSGEFTVAKEQYVRPRSGWFSDRSVCYLASGRPVITQDTGLRHLLPSDEGLFLYSDRDGALAAIEAIRSDYPRHAGAALDLARSYFRAETVLEDLVSHVGL